MRKQDAGFIAKWSRVLYLFVNFAVWIFGLILIAVGGFLLQNLYVYSFVTLTNENELNIGCWSMISLGCLVFLVGFNGVWACVRESVIWMKIYFAFMSLIIAGGLVAGCLAFIGREQARTTVKTNMKYLIQHEYGKGGIVDNGYDFIQQQEKCCGEEGPGDWSNSYFSNMTGNELIAVPLTCCLPEKKTGCNSGWPGVPANPSLVFSQGCGDVIATFQADNLTMLGRISFIMVFLETISLILVCCVIGTSRAPEEPAEKLESGLKKEEEDSM